MQKVPLYKWIILLLIPLLGIAFIVYKRLSYRPPVSHYYEDHGEQKPFEQETEKQISETVLPEPSIEDTSIQPVETKVEEPEEPKDELPAFSPEELEKKEAPKPVQEIKQPLTIKKPKNLHERREQIKKEKAGVGKKINKKEANKPSPKKELSTKSATQKEQNAQEEKHTSGMKEIALHDELTKTSLGYKHWSGRYYPSKFILKLNDVTVLTFNGKEITHVKDNISINPDKPLKAHFDFEFLGGRRHGWKEVMYQVDKNATSLNIDFDWKDPQDYQIILSPAKALSKKGGNNHDGK